ncbi:MAG TPA: hypothetical protein VF005_04185 [Acidimicrobiales bacterium]
MTRASGAGLVLAAGLALLVAACGGGSAPEASAKAADLPRLVLSQSDAPPGAQPVSSSTGPQSLAQVVASDKNGGADQRALSADGFVGAYQASFVSPNVPASGGASLFRLTTSLAALFPSAAAAAQAVQVFATTAEQGPNVTRFDASSLAPDAVGLITSTSTVVGDDYAFLWSEDRVALVVIVATDTTVQNVAPPMAVAAQVAQTVASMGPVQTPEVAQAVLQPSQAPAGTQYVADRSGPRTASQLAGQPSEANQLAQLGYQSGYQTLFAAGNLPTAGGGQAGAAFIVSSAQLYSSVSGAERAYQMQISGRLRLVGQGLQPVPTHLGAQSAGFSFKTTQGSSTFPGVLMAWRRANAVLAVYAFGPAGTVSASTVGQLATKVDQRAHGIR